MPSDVRHPVDRDQAYPLVRLTGVLDDDTVAAARSTLLDELANQPEAIVVDVAGIEEPNPGAVGMLRQVLDETRDWPGSHLALSGTTDTAVWQPSGWPIWPGPHEAFAALGAADQRNHRLASDLEPEVGAARRSREMITEACARWDQPDLTGNACIVATELVNNVVAHARTPMRFLLAMHGDTMSVAVRDGSPVVPRFTGPVAPTSYGGRGLLLIDTVSSRWGHLALSDGKVVWAQLGPHDE
ncbi:ATP-binding protein [Actinoplanes sp. OR16]|uniref:ATP-binding protein n=1 Tax=Actinoplanes sp. OR16 TaxID=946334 RepID=UPI001E39E173|nr:ATP-binding protein [Actinoplanes sp. OR16]